MISDFLGLDYRKEARNMLKAMRTDLPAFLSTLYS